MSTPQKPALDALITHTQRPRRRRCLNDDKLFAVKAHAPHQKFCSDECRKEYHHHGSAFGPLRIKVEKMIELRFSELRTMITALEVRVKRLESR